MWWSLILHVGSWIIRPPAEHLHMVVKAFLPRIIIPEKRFNLDVLSRIKITDLIIRSYNGEIGEEIYNAEMRNLTFSCYACDSTKSWKLIPLQSAVAALQTQVT